MSKAPKTIIEKVTAFLKLGNDGKIASFYERLRKTIERDIKTLQTSRTLLVSNFEQVTDKYQDNLQDAQEAVEAAWMNITPEQVATNQLQEQFMEQYLQGVSTAEAKVEAIERKYTEDSEAHAKELSVIDNKIAKAQARLAVIVGNN